MRELQYSMVKNYDLTFGSFAKAPSWPDMELSFPGHGTLDNFRVYRNFLAFLFPYYYLTVVLSTLSCLNYLEGFSWVFKIPASRKNRKISYLQPRSELPFKIHNQCDQINCPNWILTKVQEIDNSAQAYAYHRKHKKVSFCYEVDKFSEYYECWNNTLCVLQN